MKDWRWGREEEDLRAVDRNFPGLTSLPIIRQCCQHTALVVNSRGWCAADALICFFGTCLASIFTCKPHPIPSVSILSFLSGQVLRIRMARPVDRNDVLDTYQSVVSAFCEFLTVSVHTLLYERDIYPRTSFLAARKYNHAVRQSRHPKVCKWVADAVDAVRKELLKVCSQSLTSSQSFECKKRVP